MSRGSAVPWSVGADLARRLSGELAEHVVRAKTAGSIRRRRLMVSDIELVAEVRLTGGDLLGTPMPDLERVYALAEQWGRVIKQGPRYVQVHHKEGMRIDLFLVHPPAQWGSILAIRTGPAALGRELMVGLKRRGLTHRDGGVYRGAELVPVPDEATLFALAGITLVPPHQRDTLVPGGGA